MQVYKSMSQSAEFLNRMNAKMTNNEFFDNLMNIGRPQSLILYYNLLPKWARDHPTIKMIVRGLEHKQPFMSMREKINLVNLSLRFLMPIDDDWKALMEVAMFESHKENITLENVQELIEYDDDTERKLTTDPNDFVTDDEDEFYTIITAADVRQMEKEEEEERKQKKKEEGRAKRAAEEAKEAAEKQAAGQKETAEKKPSEKAAEDKKKKEEEAKKKAEAEAAAPEEPQEEEKKEEEVKKDEEETVVLTGDMERETYYENFIRESLEEDMDKEAIEKEEKLYEQLEKDEEGSDDELGIKGDTKTKEETEEKLRAEETPERAKKRIFLAKLAHILVDFRVPIGNNLEINKALTDKIKDIKEKIEKADQLDKSIPKISKEEATISFINHTEISQEIKNLLPEIFGVTDVISLLEKPELNLLIQHKSEKRKIERESRKAEKFEDFDDDEEGVGRKRKSNSLNEEDLEREDYEGDDEEDVLRQSLKEDDMKLNIEDNVGLQDYYYKPREPDTAMREIDPIPLDYYINDDGFWDDYIKFHQSKIDLKQIVYKPFISIKRNIKKEE
jgi:hypothetical protein